MSTLKRIFGRAKRLGSSPQRDSKISSPKNSRNVNTIANEEPLAEPEKSTHSITDNIPDESNSKQTEEPDSGSISSRPQPQPEPEPPTLEPQDVSPQETAAEVNEESSCGQTELAAAESSSGQTEAAAVQDALPLEEPSGASTSADQQTPQHPWSSRTDGNSLSETMQEICVVVTPRVVDSVVSEDGDGAKITRSDAGEPQQEISLTRLRQRGDELSDTSVTKTRRSRKEHSRHREGSVGEERRRKHRSRSKRNLVEGDAGQVEKSDGRRRRSVVHTSSHDDLKRTVTLPTLQCPVGKGRSSTMLKNATTGENNGGQSKLSPSVSQLTSRPESPMLLRPVRSVIVTNLVPNDIPSSDPTFEWASSEPEGTLSASGRSSNTEQPTPQRTCSSSFVAVSEDLSVSRKLSNADVERVFEELSRMQHDMHLMIVNNDQMWHRYEEDVSQLREEIDAVYIEVGNLTSELERCRKERGPWNIDEKAGNQEIQKSPIGGDDLKHLGQLFCDLNLSHEPLWSGRKKQHINAFFLQMLLSSATVKTGRSSLTLHSGEAAEAALAEQLQLVEEEGPLVPFEGNQLVVYNPQSGARFHSKPDEGSFIRRGLMRAILEVSSKARRIWSLYTRLYPIL